MPSAADAVEHVEASPPGQAQVEEEDVRPVEANGFDRLALDRSGWTYLAGSHDRISEELQGDTYGQ